MWQAVCSKRYANLSAGGSPYNHQFVLILNSYPPKWQFRTQIIHLDSVLSLFITHHIVDTIFVKARGIDLI